MGKMIVLLSMVFMHIVDDYYLQGILASMKQKSWWKEHYPQDMYKYDYLLALLMHSFSWAFCINIPVVIYGYLIGNIWDGSISWGSNISIALFTVLFIINCITHSLVDNAKANKLKINLWQDQVIHLCQILITWAVMIA